MKRHIFTNIAHTCHLDSLSSSYPVPNIINTPLCSRGISLSVFFLFLSRVLHLTPFTRACVSTLHRLQMEGDLRQHEREKDRDKERTREIERERQWEREVQRDKERERETGREMEIKKERAREMEKRHLSHEVHANQHSISHTNPHSLAHPFTHRQPVKDRAKLEDRLAANRSGMKALCDLKNTILNTSRDDSHQNRFRFLQSTCSSY